MVQSLEVTNLADVDEWPPGADLIPKERYLSREFAELEAERLWPRVWQVACREEEIPNVGDYLEYTIADQSIIVVRDQPDRLRAYFNACRHRGNMLKQGCGNAKEIRCRYHGWRWHLDGTIKEVVDAYDFNPESVSAEKLCLPECLVDTWGGFVFINMDPAAEPLQSFLGPAVLDRLGRYGWEDMRFTRYRTTVVRANWKTALDAFNDHNHLQATHPQALLFTDDVNWTYETHGRHTAMVPIPGAGGRMSPRLGDFPLQRREQLLVMIDELAGFDFVGEDEVANMKQALLVLEESIPDDMPLSSFMATLRRREADMKGIDVEAFSDDDLLIGEDWNIFPNMMTPGNGLNTLIFRFRPNGLDPESCLWDVWSLERVPEGSEPKMVEREFYQDWHDHDWGRVMTQDSVNMPNIQRGMHSRGFTHLICSRQDASIANFHRNLMTYVGGS